MLDPQIEKLLKVQSRDVHLLKIEQDLQRIPNELSSLKEKISAEEVNIEGAKKSLIEKELNRAELDAKVKDQEASINRFRIQQLEVKKNDEYRALTQQIEQLEMNVSSLEEAEIKLMIDIDLEHEKFEDDKAIIESRIFDLKRLMDVHLERENVLQDSLDKAKQECFEARDGVNEVFLNHYERIRKLTKRPPYVVPIVNQKCEGCHLRVSNEVARSAREVGEPHFCDQCARLVYV